MRLGIVCSGDLFGRILSIGMDEFLRMASPIILRWTVSNMWRRLGVANSWEASRSESILSGRLSSSLHNPLAGRRVVSPQESPSMAELVTMLLLRRQGCRGGYWVRETGEGGNMGEIWAAGSDGVSRESSLSRCCIVRCTRSSTSLWTLPLEPSPMLLNSLAPPDCRGLPPGCRGLPPGCRGLPPGWRGLPRGLELSSALGLGEARWSPNSAWGRKDSSSALMRLRRISSRLSRMRFCIRRNCTDSNCSSSVIIWALASSRRMGSLGARLRSTVARTVTAGGAKPLSPLRGRGRRVLAVDIRSSSQSLVLRVRLLLALSLRLLSLASSMVVVVVVRAMGELEGDELKQEVFRKLVRNKRVVSAGRSIFQKQRRRYSRRWRRCCCQHSPLACGHSRPHKQLSSQPASTFAAYARTATTECT